MEDLKNKITHNDCLSPETINSYLTNQLTDSNKEYVQKHIANCDVCLNSIVEISQILKKHKTHMIREFLMNIIKRINIWGILAISFFILSFVYHQHFVQFLTETIIVSLKWIMDNKNTKLLIMIHEAWKKDSSKQTSNRF